MSFDYNSGPIEVFIVTDEEGGVNGYAEINAVSQLLAPHARVGSAQLWNSAHSSYRIQNNGKSFVHALVIARYLSSVPESDAQSYRNLRQLVRDLTVGDQREPEPALEGVRLELARLVERASGPEHGLAEINGLLRILKTELLAEMGEMLRGGTAAPEPEPEAVD